MAALEGEDPHTGRFDPEVLDRSVLAIPLLRQLDEEKREVAVGGADGGRVHAVVVEINLDHVGDRAETYDDAKRLIEEAIERSPGVVGQRIVEEKSVLSKQYLFAHLGADAIGEVVDRNEQEDATRRPIFRIWPDFPIGRL